MRRPEATDLGGGVAAGRMKKWEKGIMEAGLAGSPQAQFKVTLGTGVDLLPGGS